MAEQQMTHFFVTYSILHTTLTPRFWEQHTSDSYMEANPSKVKPYFIVFNYWAPGRDALWRLLWVKMNPPIPWNALSGMGCTLISEPLWKIVVIIWRVSFNFYYNLLEILHWHYVCWPAGFNSVQGLYGTAEQNMLMKTFVQYFADDISTYSGPK